MAACLKTYCIFELNPDYSNPRSTISGAGSRDGAPRVCAPRAWSRAGAHVAAAPAVGLVVIGVPRAGAPGVMPRAGAPGVGSRAGAPGVGAPGAGSRAGAPGAGAPGAGAPGASTQVSKVDQRMDRMEAL
jgi:hypothetical protein